MNDTAARPFVKHRFSQGEVADGAKLVAAENPSRRLLMNVTMGHRRLALRQSVVSQVIGALTMVSIYIAERATPTIEQSLLHWWVIAACLNVIIRGALFYKVFTPLPAEMAKSIALRAIPLLLVLITGAHWMWTIYLFIGHELTLHVFFIFAGLIAISIAVIGMWPTVPIAAAIFLLTTWPPFFVRLYMVGWMPLPVMIFMMVSVALVIWANLYLEIGQVRGILDQSDKVELLLAKLNSANAELTEANRELDSLRQEASMALKTRSSFFSGASHDFRQRLHAMKLLAHSAIAGEDSGGRGSGSTLLHRLADSVEDVEHYVTEVLDFAKLEGTSLKPHRKSVQLQDVFQSIDLNFEEVASARGLRVHFRTADIILNTDAFMLQRILENLVSNAIKFSDDRVLIAARRRSTGLLIQVWDTGPGIPVEAQEQIFEPFFQAPSGNPAQTGVGLGLTVVARLSDCLGYKINVRSRIGNGTVMALWIPTADIVVQAEETAK